MYVTGHRESAADGCDGAPLVKPSANDKASLLRDEAGSRTEDAEDASWEAFVGKMACKGELLALDRQEQIVVKQQMLDRLMLLERELQERTVVITLWLRYILYICI